MVTRGELLQAAAIAIGRDGFEGASMRGIANAAGVSLSTLQNHFETKDALWTAVIDELLVPAMEAERQPNPGASRSRSLIADVIASRLDAAVSRPGLSGRLLTDASEAGEQRLAYLAEATESIRRDNRDTLAALRDEGLIRPVDVDALLLLLDVALASLSSSTKAVQTLVGPDLDDPYDRARIATALTDILLHGVLPRSPK